VTIAWNDDPPGSLALIASNVARLSRTLAAQAAARQRPSSHMAQAWHREIHAGVPLPVPCYAGEIRDSDLRFPELMGYEVVVGGSPGVPSAQIPVALDAFERAMIQVTGRLDAAVPAGAPPPTTARLQAVIRFAAFAHGEWVRIHPFANGNGRPARCWANFIALRYGLPAFVSIKPRPADLLYAAAARASMAGDHRPTEILFHSMLP